MVKCPEGGVLAAPAVRTAAVRTAAVRTAAVRTAAVRTAAVRTAIRHDDAGQTAKRYRPADRLAGIGGRRIAGREPVGRGEPAHDG
jgi:hypothetical protein